jgi:hypothetical protein
MADKGTESIKRKSSFAAAALRLLPLPPITLVLSVLWFLVMAAATSRVFT